MGGYNFCLQLVLFSSGVTLAGAMSSLLKFPNIFKKNPTPADISAPQGGKRVTEVKKDQRGKLVKESIPTRWIDFLKER